MPTAQIIIAEDEAPLRLLITEMLSEAGLIVRPAADGVEALELVQKHPNISLLLSDVNMPRMDGYALARFFRGRPARPLLIAYTGEFDDGLSLAAGYDHHFRKPLDPIALADLLREYARAGDQRPTPAGCATASANVGPSCRALLT